MQTPETTLVIDGIERIRPTLLPKEEAIEAGSKGKD